MTLDTATVTALVSVAIVAVLCAAIPAVRRAFVALWVGLEGIEVLFYIVFGALVLVVLVWVGVYYLWNLLTSFFT